MLSYIYLLGDYKKDELQLLEKEIEQKVIKFSESAKHVNIYLFSNYGLREAFSGDM